MDPNDGYTYNNNGSRNGITYFKCIKARTYFCNGSIKRLENGTFVTVKSHRGHGRELGINNQGLIFNFRSVLTQRAATENIPLISIYDEEARRHVVAAGLYPWSTAESIMRFTRRSTMPYCQIHYPSWPHCLKMNNSIDLNVVMLHSLEVVTEIHADATFKVVPVNMGYHC
ncbi:unnamed protein product [Macrosiphum euphorbiae]|uniref:Uncharacterized protein n=1 Tax=Macrosiphum euphorbiae TaxID=13131 RepID=A0AAV0XWI3_9HEMI|nr:unnamed protein product [Macrosiphum euphorbiae]